MAGTKAGGRKASKTNLKRYGGNFYKEIGRKGGSRAGIIKGFAANPELARKAGAKGGRASKRGKARAKISGPNTSAPMPFGEF